MFHKQKTSNQPTNQLAVLSCGVAALGNLLVPCMFVCVMLAACAACTELQRHSQFGITDGVTHGGTVRVATAVAASDIVCT